MFQILDVATLLRLLNIAPETVRDTIEAGGWTGWAFLTAWWTRPRGTSAARPIPGAPSTWPTPT